MFKVFNVDIEKEDFDKFKTACLLSGESMSATLRGFILRFNLEKMDLIENYPDVFKKINQKKQCIKSFV